MVYHQGRGQRPQARFVQREVAAVHLKIDVPAQGLDARSQWLEMVPAQCTAGQHHEAHAANTRLVQVLQLWLADVRLDHGNAARLST